MKKYKAILFSTTLRNPERIGDFLCILEKFHGTILNMETLIQIFELLIKNKIYYPQKALKEFNWYDEYMQNKLTNKQIKKIINYLIETESHKEANYPKGLPSRFETYFQLIKEFGLATYEWQQQIIISSIGFQFKEAFEKNDFTKQQFLMLNILTNWCSKNPARKVDNKFRLIPLLAKIFLILEKKNINFLYKYELGIIMSSLDNDADRLVKEILYFRENFNEEEFLNYYRKKLNQSDKRLKANQLLMDIPDSTIRKLKFSGFIISKNSKTIQINEIFLDILVDLAALNDEKLPKFDDYTSYINYMSTTYPFLETKFNQIISGDNKEKNLNYWSEELKKINLNIDNLLKSLEKRGRDNIKNELFSEVPKSILLEFLFSIKLHETCLNSEIIPNYIADDTGFPIYHAPAGKPDIIIKSKNSNAIIELTLLTGDQDQVVKEMIPITDHLTKFSNDNVNSACWYISPYIGNRIITYCKFIKFEQELTIIPNTISESIEILNNL